MSGDNEFQRQMKGERIQGTHTVLPSQHCPAAGPILWDPASVSPMPSFWGDGGSLTEHPDIPLK